MLSLFCLKNFRVVLAVFITSISVMAAKKVDQEIAKPIPWTRPMVQELIDLVEEEKIIWDYTQPVYRKRLLRKDAFNRVCKKMKSCSNIKSEEVTKKWQNLKSYFNTLSSAERKATASGAGCDDTQAVEGEAVWEHYKSMSFLKPISGVTPMIENFCQPQEKQKCAGKVINPISFCESVVQIEDDETCSQWQARQCAKQSSKIHQKFAQNPVSDNESESVPYCESGSQGDGEVPYNQRQAKQCAEQGNTFQNTVTISESRSQTDDEDTFGHEQTDQSQNQMALNENQMADLLNDDLQEQVQKNISSQVVMPNATSSSRGSHSGSHVIKHPQKKRRTRNIDNSCDDIGDVVIEFLKENKAQNANSTPNLSANEKRGLIWGQDIDKIKNKNARCSCIINVTKVIQEALMNDEDENT